MITHRQPPPCSSLLPGLARGGVVSAGLFTSGPVLFSIFRISTLLPVATRDACAVLDGLDVVDAVRKSCRGAGTVSACDGECREGVSATDFSIGRLFPSTTSGLLVSSSPTLVSGDVSAVIGLSLVETTLLLLPDSPVRYGGSSNVPVVFVSDTPACRVSGARERSPAASSMSKSRSTSSSTALSSSAASGADNGSTVACPFCQ
jgi:hypothetical protein